MMNYRSMPEDYRKSLIEELRCEYLCEDTYKDILIVIHNQDKIVYKCLESLHANTNNFRLYIWDNASNDATRKIIESFSPFFSLRSEKNIGFILPNNFLAKITKSPYLILLNSDTVVKKGWDLALLGWLQQHSEYGAVGYQGGLLNNKAIGYCPKWGSEIDYIQGWCLCFHREIYNSIGLFDENLQIAYGEDSDFCLRLKNTGKNLYALHLDYVEHIGNATAKTVNDFLKESFQKNHSYLQKKWFK